jgi:predicted metalloprotease with PDZ domain
MAIDLTAALQNVSQKISDAAGTASPEELAYLGTALDRIAGRATIGEVMQAGDVQKAAINTVGDAAIAAVMSVVNTEVAAAITAMSSAAAVTAQQALNGSLYVNYYFHSFR